MQSSKRSFQVPNQVLQSDLGEYSGRNTKVHAEPKFPHNGHQGHFSLIVSSSNKILSKKIQNTFKN
jgi:hypothetical protein